ncbi:MAG: insulinase family protein [Oligoflexia bacterium]|nr:insulinase family protein [Oligoflexia bacterium]
MMNTNSKMKNSLATALVALAITGLGLAGSGCAGKPVQPSTTASAAAQEAIPLVGTFKVNRYVLDNGLKLLVVEDHTSPTFAYQTWFRVGSRDESPGRTGLAHLFEHMMFKETRTLKEGEFDRILEGAGAEGENAFTSQDYTAYIQELPKDKLELIARLEADRMVNLIINDQAFKTETEVVQNERRFRNENNPDGLIFQELFETAFTKHPYRWPVIGYQQDLNSMKGQDGVDFYRSFYSPNHATIVIVGDVKPEEALAMVKKHYDGIAAQPTPARSIEAEPPQASSRHKTLKLNMKNEKLLMGYRVPAITHEDVPALNLLQSVLSGGKSSRLHRALVETGIAGSVEAYSADSKDPSLFLVSCNLQKGRKAAQAEAVILRELARLAQQPVGEKELEKARNNISFGFFSGLEGNFNKARFLGTYEAVAEGFEAGLNVYQRTLAVNALELQAVARRYFQNKNRTVIMGVPK